MYINEIFNQDTINIFTDASIKKLSSGETIGCAGSISIIGDLKDRKIYTDYRVIRNTTNNNSEIKAIRLGVENAIFYSKLYGLKKVKLFSDSQISILGLRDRIFNWNYRNNIYTGSEGKPIKNQEVFLEIVYTILENNLNINFYHQKGHVNYHNNDSLYNAMHVFSVSNNIREFIDLDFIKQISKFNDDIDVLTGQVLEDIYHLESNQYIEPIYFKSNLFNKNKYFNLIKT